MADNMIHEMIAAFAAGCMDKENFIQFKKYIASGGALPEGELGELQNIISMLPVILDLENPDPSIKDMVAKKLISMKEEIKTQIIEGKKNTFATKIKTEIPDEAEDEKRILQNTPELVSKKDLTGGSTPQPAGKEGALKTGSGVATASETNENAKTGTAKEKIPAEDPRRLEAIPPPSFNKTAPTKEPELPKSPEKITSAAGWISLLLTVILFTILGYYTYNSVDSVNNEVKDLKKDIVSLKDELGSANNFIANYASLIEFFNYKDINVVNLTAPDINEKSSARLLLSFSQKEGIIQFKIGKPLPADKVYQVWAVSRGTAASLGVYFPRGEEYLKITSFPAIPKEQIGLFRITIESKNGTAAAPSADYLTGAMTDLPARSGRY